MADVSLGDSRIARGGVALVATLQWLLAVVVAATAWSPVPFTIMTNPVSDLGVPECVLEPRVVCSPYWFVFDAAMVVHAVAIVIAALSLRALPASTWRSLLGPKWVHAGLALAVVHAVGVLLAGVFPAFPPGSVRDDVHTLGLSIAGTTAVLLMLVVGMSAPAKWRRWAIFSHVVAAAIAAFTIIALVVGGQALIVLDLVRMGGTVLWTSVTGFALLTARRNEFERDRIRAAQEGR